ncbi:MAG TPA: DUF6569 family protein [Parafilimonas sp.]|nr:DUF6569 family protein [Parafilimonas sp.]
MKHILTLIFLALCLFSFSQYTYKNLQVNYTDTNVAKTYTWENLRLYPVYANADFKAGFKTVGKYVSLQEAIVRNKIKITEKENGGSVNDLTIENISTDTIIIIPGDVIKGGQQDRIIAKDMLLKPKSGKLNVPVYCVESGRWSARSNTAAASRNNSNAPAEFKSYYSKGAVSLRKVVEKEEDQSKVWNKVDEMNSKNKTSTATKTYTALNNSTDFNKRLEQYTRFFGSRFSVDENIIGVVVVTGDRVLGCDMFATHDLFIKQYTSLLHSYATEAILNGKPVAVSPAVVKAYMDKLLMNETVQQTTLKSKGSAFTDKGKKLRVSCFD